MREWLTADTTYDGLPIFFRRPDLSDREVNTFQSKFTTLVTIQHNLKHVMDNGLPEPQYNKQLVFLDEAITKEFREEDIGIVALIETFAGNRTYYIYICESFNTKEFQDNINQRFDESIDWSKGNDANWDLYFGYSREFGFT